jgi:DNA-binding CsgD family transcriptional regulator
MARIAGCGDSLETAAGGTGATEVTSMSANDIRMSRFKLGRDSYLVVSFGSETTRSALEGLTAAERAVVELAVRGMSAEEVAARRGRSLHTVTNQLASAYRKLGVSSRAELAALIVRGAPPPPSRSGVHLIAGSRR